MRYFWSLIVLLALVTGGLFTMRVSAERAEMVPVADEPAPAPSFGRSGTGSRDPGPATTPGRDAPRPPAEPAPVAADDTPVARPEPTPEPARSPESVAAAEPEPVRTAPVRTPEPEATAAAPEPAPSEITAPDTEPVSETAERAGSSFSLDELLGLVSESAERVRQEAPGVDGSIDEGPATASSGADSQTGAAEDPMMAAAAAAQTRAAEPAPAQAAPSGPVGPAFERQADGSLRIDGVGVVRGQGSAQSPYVLDWDALRSLSREYNPRQGNDQLPGWILELDGKHVRIEGNTLLPVVAQSTDELLLMQNPWDGCCLGVPPTPYDAIEVKLGTPQRLGNSPTGYGQVEGVFKVDPYIVSGWLLGLYMIENASFESAAGVTLPDF